MAQAHILMCEPVYYGVEYEINPWMDRRRQPDHQRALGQWRDLRRLIEEAGASVSCLAPVAGLPDLVFTANAALVYRGTAILSQFRHPQRRGEQPYDREWFIAHGFEVRQLSSGAPFEGAGDALFCGDILFAGYRIRSDIRALQEIGKLLHLLVIPLELVDPYFYHLDTCFCPVAPGVVFYYPPAFDEYAQRVLEETVDELVPVSEVEARRFACNSVVIGKTVLTPVGCPEFHAQLAAREYRAMETPLDEFIKAGGAAKCLTLRLDGEEAAAWAEQARRKRMQAVESLS